MGRFDALKNIDDDLTGEVQKNHYESNFNFKDYDITDEKFIKEIRNIESRLYNSWTVVQHRTKEMCQYLYEAQEKFKDKKEGSFMAWYKSIGLSKDQVSISIMKYKQYLNYGKNPKALETSKRTIKYLNQQAENLPGEKVEEILNNPDRAADIIKELKENEIIDYKTEVEKIDEEINKLKTKIKKLEAKKRELIK